MTTTIVPSSGAGCLFTQQGVGTTPGYSALDLRRSDIGGLQEGVLGAGASAQDFMVQQRIAGATMQVEITMPTSGMAAVQGDTITGQGLYDVPVHSANILETIGTADPTNPRIDQIILEVQDNVLDASGGNVARTRVVAGTATGGANLTNRTGAAALPGSALLLADVLVGAAAGSITNSVIRDRRKWARGAYSRYARTSADYTLTSAVETEIDTTNIRQRIECSGAPVRVSLQGMASSTAAAGVDCSIGVWLDGALVSGGRRSVTMPSANYNLNFNYDWELLPAAGSHLISLAWFVGSGTITLKGGTTFGVQYAIEEFVRQNTANNIVTSG